MSTKAQHAWIAECRCGDWLVTEEGGFAVAYPDPANGAQAESVARLIAAAPELLEALQCLCRAFDEHARSATFNGARAAIAKALGEG